jgi:hypothetical protein
MKKKKPPLPKCIKQGRGGNKNARILTNKMGTINSEYDNKYNRVLISVNIIHLF